MLLAFATELGPHHPDQHIVSVGRGPWRIGQLPGPPLVGSFLTAQRLPAAPAASWATRTEIAVCRPVQRSLNCSLRRSAVGPGGRGPGHGRRLRDLAGADRSAPAAR